MSTCAHHWMFVVCFSSLSSDLMKLCGESKPKSKVEHDAIFFCDFCTAEPFLFSSIVKKKIIFKDLWMSLILFKPILVSQARRRTTTQMELLYANSGNLSCVSPTGDIPSPLLPLAEGPADVPGLAPGQSFAREQTASPSAPPARPAGV